MKARLTKSQLKRLKAKQRHSRCRTLRESAKLAKREAELSPVAALPHVAEPSLIVTGQPVGQPHELRLALQQERQARIAAEVWCETLNLARIAEMRERAYQMAPPFVVTPKLGAVHLVMLPSYCQVGSSWLHRPCITWKPAGMSPTKLREGSQRRRRYATHPLTPTPPTPASSRIVFTHGCLSLLILAGRSGGHATANDLRVSTGGAGVGEANLWFMLSPVRAGRPSCLHDGRRGEVL